MADTQTVTTGEWDAQGNPVQAGVVGEWDASGNPVTSKDAVPTLAPSHDPIDYNRLSTALVTSHMTGMPVSEAYTNHDQVQGEFAKHGVEAPIPATIANDIKVGAEGSVFGLAYREKMPESLHNATRMDNFISSLSQMVSDLPVYLAGAAVGGFAGGAVGSAVPVVGTAAGAAGGASMGTFAIPEAMRESLRLGIEKGEIKSFGDLMERTLATFTAAEKGALTGLLVGAAGKSAIPLGKGASPATDAILKNQQQAAVLTLLPALLEGHMPTASDFATNSILMGSLGLATHGVPIAAGDAKRALLDVYAKDGTLPRDTAARLQAQPPVKPEAKPGLQPAIRLTAKDGSTQVISGEHDTHSDLAKATTGTHPVTIDQLNSDPTLADRVLSRPETHVQQVIDRAYELKQAEGTDTELPPKSSLKSGRGFVTPSGDYLSRSQAKNWIKENEPDVHEAWLRGGDDKREFHSQDYKDARERAGAMDTAKGENAYSAMTPEQAQRIAAFREDLNNSKASMSDKGYGEMLRTFVVGQKDLRTAIANDLRRSMLKVLPDAVDRQALTFIRDYRGDEQGLRSMLDAIKSRDIGKLQDRLDVLKNKSEDGFDYKVDEKSIDRLQEAIPAIERALNPTADMMAVDAELTKYTTATLDEARGLGILDSTIPPDKYITHILREADAEEGGGLSRPKLTTKTPYGIQRTYPTTIDAMIAGKVPRTLDALDALTVYGDRHAIAAATRLFATEIKNSELGKWGTQSSIPADWKRLGDGRLFEYTGVNEKTGETFTTALYVPKKIAEAMRPITERKALFQSPAGKAFRKVQSQLKAAFVGLSIFHSNALTHSAINNMGIDIVKVVQDSMDSPEFRKATQEWSGDGLITSRSRTPHEVYRGMEGVSSFEAPDRMDVVRNIYGIKQLNQLAEKTTHLTFDVIQTKYKVTDATAQEAAWLAKHPDATDQEHFAARRSIAKEVNAVYGGLNWEAMGWGPNAVELMRAVMLAPDWSFSNVYSLKYAMPKSLGGEGGNPGGKAARMFWFRSAVNGLALTQATSLLITGQMSKNPTQVYIGKDDKGKEMYSSWYFAGAPKDFITQLNAWKRDGAITGTAEFLSYKLGPLVGTAPRLLVNKDWSGKPIIKKTQGFAEKTGREALFVTGEVFPAPFSAKTAVQMLLDPDKDYTYKDFLSGLAGAPVYHRPPEDGGKLHLPGTRHSKFHKGAR